MCLPWCYTVSSLGPSMKWEPLPSPVFYRCEARLTPVDSYSDRTGIQATFSPASWLPTLPPPTTLFDHHTMWLFKQQSLSHVLALGQEAKSRFWKTGPYLNFFLKGRERETETETGEFSHTLIHPPNICNNQVVGQVKAKCQEFHLGLSQEAGGDPATWVISIISLRVH